MLLLTSLRLLWLPVLLELKLQAGRAGGSRSNRAASSNSIHLQRTRSTSRRFFALPHLLTISFITL